MYASIKEERYAIYEQIKIANERLEELQKDCLHPNSSEGNYSWRVGSSFSALICDDCGKVLQNYDFPILRGEDARRFQAAVEANATNHVSKEVADRINANYEKVSGVAKF